MEVLAKQVNYSWNRHDAGNQVVAYVRDPTKLDIKSDRLAIIQGELVDEEKIESVLKGAGAVLSALGPKGGSKRYESHYCSDEETEGIWVRVKWGHGFLAPTSPISCYSKCKTQNTCGRHQPLVTEHTQLSIRVASI